MARLRTPYLARFGVIRRRLEVSNVPSGPADCRSNEPAGPHFTRSRRLARVDDRRVVSGIVYVIRNGLQ
jgi:hypothetical protein